MTNPSLRAEVSPVSTFRGSVTNRHFPALDGVRGLAILLVLVVHLLAANRTTGNAAFDFLSGIAGSCWVGVDLFFVLSGFLITGILFDSLGDPHYFQKFYVRRVLRIFPLYYGILLLFLLLTNPLHLEWSGMQYSLLLYLQNTGLWTPIQGFRPAWFLNFNHFWSLAVEEQFYMVWPFAIFLIRDARKLMGLSAVLCVLALLLRFVLVTQDASPDSVFAFTACRADALLVGGLLALSFRLGLGEVLMNWSRPVFWTCVPILLGVAIDSHGLDPRTGRFIPSIGFTLIALAAAAVLVETFREGSLAHRFFGMTALRSLGRYSYGIYVYHYILDAFLTGRCRAMLLAATHSKGASVAGGALVVGGISIGIAVVSYRYFELPFLKLKRYFEYEAARSGA